MALAKAPSTPIAQIAQTTGLSTPSPGNWRHPKFDEIARRQNASTFTDSNVRRIIWNGGGLFILWIAGNFIKSYPEATFDILPLLLQQNTSLFFNIVYLIPVFNILVSLSPLVRKKDNLADVALTPSQRALLGLDPKDTPPVTPTTKYVTPPRYPRSSTPRNASPGSRGSDNHNSPLSRNGSPLVGLQASDSPVPSSPSPLWHQAVASSQDFGRRSSFGSSSSSLFRIGPSAKDHGILGASSTPSPSAGRGASVSLNNRWLYERGRADSGSRGLYS